MQLCKTSVMWAPRIYLQLNFYTVINITHMGKGDNMSVRHASIEKRASGFFGSVLFTNGAIHRSSVLFIGHLYGGFTSHCRKCFLHSV